MEKKRLVILGAGGHGKVVADIADEMEEFEEILFLDDESTEEYVLDFPIVGKCKDYEKWGNDTAFFVAIGNSEARERWTNILYRSGRTTPCLIHPKAVIGQESIIGYGTAIMAGAVVNPGCIIGNGVILNTCSSIDHDNRIGDYCHVSVGAHLAGNVKVGKHTMIGAGATVINNVEIADNCMIGAGAVVVKDIDEKGTYAGVPARKI